ALPIPRAQHALVAAATEEHRAASPGPDRSDPLRHNLVTVGDGPPTVDEAPASVFVRTSRALHDPVEANVVEYDDIHRPIIAPLDVLQKAGCDRIHSGSRIGRARFDCRNCIRSHGITTKPTRGPVPDRGERRLDEVLATSNTTNHAGSISLPLFESFGSVHVAR